MDDTGPQPLGEDQASRIRSVRARQQEAWTCAESREHTKGTERALRKVPCLCRADCAVLHTRPLPVPSTLTELPEDGPLGFVRSRVDLRTVASPRPSGLCQLHLIGPNTLLLSCSGTLQDGHLRPSFPRVSAHMQKVRMPASPERQKSTSGLS